LKCDNSMSGPGQDHLSPSPASAHHISRATIEKTPQHDGKDNSQATSHRLGWNQPGSTFIHSPFFRLMVQAKFLEIGIHF
jgi:hypothetical protein